MATVLQVGTVLARRYRLTQPLGRGATAQAYVAEDLLEQESVALKVLRDPALLDVLRAEFERLRACAHPCLVRARDLSRAVHQGELVHFYSADLVAGVTLDAFAVGHPFADARAAFADVLEALHVLHLLGLRHGDVKPENVLVRADGRAVLIDLGCAAPLGQRLHALSGTPHYLAPELLQGEAGDERSDLYALGVMLRDLYPEAVPELAARLTAQAPQRRPATAKEALSLLGVERDLDRHRFAHAPRLLGREHELARAEAGLAGFFARRPGPRVLWLSGPSGAGHSRLLRELSYRLSQRAELLEARALRENSLRDALARVLGELAPGPEAFVAGVGELAQQEQPHVLVLDDVDRLVPPLREQLAWLLRSLPSDGNLLVLLAGCAGRPDFLPDATSAPETQPGDLEIPLAPLSPEALAAWSEGLVAPELVTRLWEHTGGYPREVESTLDALLRGALSEADLGRSVREPDARRELALRTLVGVLSRAASEALAQIAVQGHSQAEAAQELQRLGLVRRGRAGFVLAREADRELLPRVLDARTLRRLHAQGAHELSGSSDPEQVARTVWHLFGAGEWVRALSLFETAEPWLARAPQAFVQALRGQEARLPAHARVLYARVLRLAAEPRRALSVLARGLRGLPGDLRPQFWSEAAEARLSLGAARRALRCLAAIPAELWGPEQRELQARLLARTGGHAHARERALELLAQATESGLRARALETLALAEAYLGEDASALAHVAEAAQLHAASDARALVRCEAFRGFVLFRAGQVSEAAEACARTLERAEALGLADLLVNALLNLGSARHMLGSYGSALSLYERALRLARALGRAGSVRLLRINLANLSLEVGSFERAEAEFARLVAENRASDLPATLALYRAELALLQGEPERALTELATAPAAGHERKLALTLRGLALVRLGRLGEALDCARELADGSVEAALDLAVQTAELHSELALAEAQPRRALPELERLLPRARAAQQEPLLARLEARLAQLCQALDSPALAEEHRGRARARYERMALDLAPSLRDAFWAHPRRRGLREGRASQQEPLRGRSTLSFARYADLSRRINSSLSVSEILDHAMDAAIELTLAERGFVLLAGEPGGLTVRAARKFDRAELKRREHELSRSIAERVVETGEPVLTVDAGADARFARHASVHAMRLKSVLCVPVRGQGKLLGALYLDNRLERARFSEGDVELLSAFAEQVAIALDNARLFAELEHRTRELSREKRKVEELLSGKTADVERLEEALRLSRAAFRARHEYAQIIGKSEPMRRVLGVLDRVVESDVNVLVTGESGTGKELVARAIHAYGARKNGPFVSINCPALPETLLEAELFGHVRGAFTGAERDREGLLRAAHRGTLFLDELGEMPLGMQAKLLRVLADREVRPVGASHSLPVDARLVCATNRNLLERVKEGAFREDLYYRVAVVSVTMPPLRERSEDIVPIAEALLKRRAEEQGGVLHRLTPDAVRALLAHPWPGNVRELDNVLARASVLSRGELIRAEDLALGKPEPRVRKAAKNRKDFEALEAERLLAALESERWNVSAVARNLGIPRNTLYRKLARYGIRVTPRA